MRMLNRSPHNSIRSHRFTIHTLHTTTYFQSSVLDSQLTRMYWLANVNRFKVIFKELKSRKNSTYKEELLYSELIYKSYITVCSRYVNFTRSKNNFI